MSFVSYAQNFEDVVLWRALGDIVAGSYLDIGAQDPVFDSVSLAFYQAGWRGIHVEPTPAYAARLREERPDEVVIEAAVSDAPGPLELHEFCGTGLSTGKSEIAARHVERGFSGQKIIVPCVRLDKLLETTGDIHWMKIDVEGMESEVLASWGKSVSRPWVVVVEATTPMEQSPTDHLWRREVEGRGYSEVYFDGLSRYFLHEDHAALTERFEAPANVFDRFQVSSHHFSIQQFAQNTSNEISEAGSRAEQLQAELSMTNDQLATASADADKAEAKRAAAKERALALEEQLAALSAEADVARAERVGAIEALAKVREEHTLALDQAWRERHAFEIGLREQWAAKEEEYRQADAAREAELRSAGTKVAALDERASRQAIEIERLATAKGTLERTAAEFSKEIGALHASNRSEIKAHEERARKERDRLSNELAQREAELSAAKGAIDRHASDIGELKKAKAGLDQQVHELNSEIAALHASHRSETGALEERARKERDHLSSELAQREAELSAVNAAIDRLEQDTQRERADAAAQADRIGQDKQREVAEANARAEHVEREMQGQLAEADARTYRLEQDIQREVAEAEARADRVKQDSQSEISKARLQLNMVILQRDRADLLIRTFLAERQSRWSHLAIFLGLRHSSPARRALAGWSLPSGQPAIIDTAARSPINTEAGATMPSPAYAGGRNPYLRADSLAELLSWHDVDFVRCAYVTVLGRQPDPDGEAYYTDRIRRGHSKMEVLWQLRRSPEGADHDPGIAGLDKMLRRHHNARLPFLGSIIRALTGREGDSTAERQFRALNNHVAAVRHEQTLGIAAIQRRLDDYSAELDAIHTESQAIGKSVLQLHALGADRGVPRDLPENAPAAPHEQIPYCPPALGPTAARLYRRIKSLTAAGDGPTKCAL